MMNFGFIIGEKSLVGIMDFFFCCLFNSLAFTIGSIVEGI